MLRCTYVVLIQDNEKNIPALIESLKNVTGAFRKEFIIVDDGSKDNSLNVLKSVVSELPRTTIITQEHSGSTVSINKALSLVTGDFVHFVEGSEVLFPDSTHALVEACVKLGTDVAFGRTTKMKSQNQEISNMPNYKVIENPIREILNNEIVGIRSIGLAGSLVQHDLLEKVAHADSGIYTHNVSLSLRCAKYSKFAFVDETVSFLDDAHQHEGKFEAYNTLKAIYNFARNHPILSQDLLPELIKALQNETIDSSAKINYSLRSFVAKYIKSTNLDKVLSLYKNELDKLF